ncbi:MAG: hypothetical protein ACFCU1_05270 [Sumerlaeia bacterium]
MIFYFFPIGLSTIKLRHVFIAYAFCCMLIYRFAATLFFPDLQVKVIAFTLYPKANTELFSALFQSLITPFSTPDLPSWDHAIMTVIGSCALVIFWIVFGSSFEMRLKKSWFLILFALSVLLACLVAFLPVFSVNPVYSILQGSTFVFLGMTFTLFMQDDVKFFYHYFTIFGTHNQGRLEFPAPIFAAIWLLILAVPCTMYWYPESEAIDLPLRHGIIPAFGWIAILTTIGALIGLLIEKVSPHERV